jgi:hypothetical protein
MVLSLQSLSPMRNASAKRRVKSNPRQMTITPKTKTSSAILKILKILIQNQMTAGKFILKPNGVG